MSEPSEEEKARAMMQLQQVVQGQQITMKILGKCFMKCVDPPGDQLSEKEQSCIYNCTQRVFDTEQFCAKRLQAMTGQGAGQ